MNRLNILRGRRQSVEKVLSDILVAQREEAVYDPNCGVKERERRKAIVSESEDEKLITSCQRSEMIVTETVILLNELTHLVAWSIVAELSRRNSYVNKTRRAHQICGCHDSESGLSQCQRFRDQLTIGI